MRAIRIREPGGPEVLEAVERPDPEPVGREVRVRVRAAALNRADLLQRRGAYPAPPGAPADIPGLECAGEVEAVGPGVVDLRPGARVMGLLPGGGYAEKACLPEEMALPIPAGMTWEEAAGVPEVFLTAYDALFHRGGLEAGEALLVHAAGGGVGSAAIQLGRVAGAWRIFGTASAEKLRGLDERGLGPDVAVDYEARSFREAVAEGTDGRGVDVILETVGAPYWEDDLASLATLGRLVLVGLLGGAEVRVDLRTLMTRRATVVGTVLRSRPLAEKIALSRQFRTRMLPLFEAGRLRPLIDRAFPLDRAADAHRYMEENRNLGKIVLTV